MNIVQSTAARAGRSLFSAWTPDHDGPCWAPWLWTALFNSALALMLTVSLPDGGGYWRYFVTSQAIGLTIHALFAGLGNALRMDMFALPLGMRMAYVVTVVLAGSWIGYSLATWALLGDLDALRQHLGRASWALMVVPPLSALAMVVILSAVNRVRQQQLSAERAETARVLAEHEVTAARLQLLNAQIEPHFLYNTLAHVSALLTRDPAAARGMLDDLIAYLRVSSRNMAHALVPFDDELDSVRGYLAVMQRRLGGRLEVHYELAQDLPACRVPPASLQTLVENAIKHGIEPSARGGAITIRADAREGRVRIVVADTGIGLGGDAATTASGTGLANLRERLQLSLGSACTVRLESDAGGETRAVIELPAPRDSVVPGTAPLPLPSRQAGADAAVGPSANA